MKDKLERKKASVFPICVINASVCISIHQVTEKANYNTPVSQNVKCNSPNFRNKCLQKDTVQQRHRLMYFQWCWVSLHKARMFSFSSLFFLLFFISPLLLLQSPLTVFMTQTASPDKEESVRQVPPFLLLWIICPSCSELASRYHHCGCCGWTVHLIPHLSGFLTPSPTSALILNFHVLN